MRRALVVDDEELLRVLIRETLDAAGWHVEVAADADEARRLAGATPFDVALIDVNLVGHSGLDLCRALLAVARGAPPAIVFMSGDPDLLDAPGAHGFLAKPFRASELLDVIERCVGPGPS